MHIEILVEDSSGKKLLEALLPKLLGVHGEAHTWNMHSYKGIGHIPKETLNNSIFHDPSSVFLVRWETKTIFGA